MNPIRVVRVVRKIKIEQKAEATHIPVFRHGTSGGNVRGTHANGTRDKRVPVRRSIGHSDRISMLISLSNVLSRERKSTFFKGAALFRSMTPNGYVKFVLLVVTLFCVSWIVIGAPLGPLPRQSRKMKTFHLSTGIKCDNNNDALDIRFIFSFILFQIIQYY
ncbi:hypothetical protein WA026_007786 [Henosepilachna vigintioctopunctata]|uniref:Transmembrane protein n=1 Tax=Henosepilachna vigintioctopunctata TaxID=420089 RepID=A0AAW1U4A3_9CUCU